MQADLLAVLGPGVDPQAVRRWLQAGHTHSGHAVRWLEPASEVHLRQTLAVAAPRVLVLAGQWASSGGAYATLSLADSAGQPRRINVQTLAPLLSSPSGVPVLPLLVSVAGSVGARGDAGVEVAAAVLLSKGVRTAVTLRLPATAPMSGLNDDVSGLQSALRRWQGGGTAAEFVAALAAPLQARLHGDAAARGPAGGALSPVAELVELAMPSAAAAAGSVDVPTSEASAPSPPSAAELRLQQSRQAGQFDVFLCHNSEDKPAVRELAQALLKRGVLPWFDEWELRPGLPWQKLLEQQIAAIGSAAVCIGPAGIGRWHEMEMRGFLDEFVRRELPVMAVLLLPPGAADPELPLFLRHFTWVDYRQPQSDPLARLVWGITGQRPDGLGRA